MTTRVDAYGSQKELDTYQKVISYRLRQVALSQGFLALQNGADLSTLDEDSQAYANVAKILACVMNNLSETCGDLSGWVCAAAIGNGQMKSAHIRILTASCHQHPPMRLSVSVCGKRAERHNVRSRLSPKMSVRL